MLLVPPSYLLVYGPGDPKRSTLLIFIAIVTNIFVLLFLISRYSFEISLRRCNMKIIVTALLFRFYHPVSSILIWPYFHITYYPIAWWRLRLQIMQSKPLAPWEWQTILLDTYHIVCSYVPLYKWTLRDSVIVYVPFSDPHSIFWWLKPRDGNIEVKLFTKFQTWTSSTIFCCCFGTWSSYQKRYHPINRPP